MKTILNVIERPLSNNISVESFADNEVEEAEINFSTKALENGCLKEDVETYLEAGYYENGHYELYLVWSN